MRWPPHAFISFARFWKSFRRLFTDIACIAGMVCCWRSGLWAARGARAFGLPWRPRPCCDFLLAEVTGLFRSWDGVAVDREATCAAVTWALTVPLFLAIGFVAGKFDGAQATLSRRVLLAWFLLAPTAIVAVRIGYRRVLRVFRRQGWNTRGCAIIGANELGFQLARNIESSPQMGLTFVGFFDDRPAQRRAEVPSDVGRCLGNLDDLLDQTRAMKARAGAPFTSRVAVAGGARREERAGLAWLTRRPRFTWCLISS